METFAGHEFSIQNHTIVKDQKDYKDNYFYVIYKPKYVIGKDYFETKEEARLAAIGHLSLIEKGIL